MTNMAANSGMMANRSMLGLGRYDGNRLMNKSTLSCLNNRSMMMVSDTSQDMSAYVSKDMVQPKFGESNRDRSGFLSSLFN